MKKTMLILAAMIALVVGVGLLLPSKAHVERSITLKATPPTVFTVLNSFSQFQKWSPWADLDPNLKVTYSGPAEGVGARMEWTGNSKAGTGSQEIVESTSYSHIKVKLDFGMGGGDFTATYAIAPQDDGTKLTWSFDGDYGGSLVGRYFGLLSERMIGPDYEKGLGRLKAVVEGLPRADYSNLEIGVVETRAEPIVLTSARSPDDSRAIGVALGVSYSKLSGFINAQGLKQVGPPLAIYYGVTDGTLSFEPAIPVDRVDVKAGPTIRTGTTFAGRAVRAVYRGPYAGLPGVHQQVLAYLAAAGLKQAGPMWEQYVSDPAKTPDADLVTHLYYPVQ